MRARYFYYARAAQRAEFVGVDTYDGAAAAAACASAIIIIIIFSPPPAAVAAFSRLFFAELFD